MPPLGQQPPMPPLGQQPPMPPLGQQPPMPPLVQQPPMPPLGQQPPVPLPAIGQPMNIPPPPPPPSVGLPSVCQPPVVHPIMGQPPILNHQSLTKQPISQMNLNQPVIAPPPIGLPVVPPISQPTHPLSIRSDLMPTESTDLEMDHQDSVQEPECEPPAPGTEELPIEEIAPTPSKFLIYVIIIL